jgi:hypothetical protein
MSIKLKQTRTIDDASRLVARERSLSITLTKQESEWLDAGLSRLIDARHKAGKLEEVDQLLAFASRFYQARTPA